MKQQKISKGIFEFEGSNILFRFKSKLDEQSIVELAQKIFFITYAFRRFTRTVLKG